MIAPVLSIVSQQPNISAGVGDERTKRKKRQAYFRHAIQMCNSVPLTKPDARTVAQQTESVI